MFDRLLVTPPSAQWSAQPARSEMLLLPERRTSTVQHRRHSGPMGAGGLLPSPWGSAAGDLCITYSRLRCPYRAIVSLLPFRPQTPQTQTPSSDISQYPAASARQCDASQAHFSKPPQTSACPTNNGHVQGLAAGNSRQEKHLGALDPTTGAGGAAAPNTVLR